MTFLLALSFLTALPVPIKDIAKEEDLGRSVRWFPLVGALIGALTFGVFAGLSKFFPSFVSSVFTLGVWVWVTRALHLDGVADTFDGLGCGGGKKALEVMKDSRVGTFAVAAVFLVLAMKTALMASFGKTGSFCLFLSPILGRWAIGFSIWRFGTARPDGLGRSFKDHCGAKEGALSAFFALGFSLLFGYRGLFVFLVSGTAAFLTGLHISSKLGGLTGDSYGCICEFTEISALFAGSLLLVSGV